MNKIELKLGRDMETELLQAKDEYENDEKLIEAIELVLKKVVYPLIDRNIE